MPPNNELADPTSVGEYQADNKDLFDYAAKQAQKKKKKMVDTRFLGKSAILPEQGSWHYDRKKKVLEAHPEVKELYGQNPFSTAIMLVGVAAQTFVGLQMANYSWWVVLLCSYTLGTYLSWVCMVMGHEGSHGLVWKNKAMNKLHTIIAFLPVFTGPFGSFWSIEHMYHHQVVVDKMDRYGPQQAPLLRKLLTSLLFINVLSVLFTLTSVIAFTRTCIRIPLYLMGKVDTIYAKSYRFRPYNNFPQVANSPWFFLNMGLIFAFNAFCFSKAGITPIVYFFLSNGFCNGLHPLGMRQVQEHYIQRKNQPTNSVYSPLSFLLLNIGYHNEHHDFPTIPWNRLPEVRRLAPEFYDNLFYYKSYTEVLISFLTDQGIPYTSLLEEMYETDPSKVPAGTKVE